jgi:cytochrome c peroxidase
MRRLGLAFIVLSMHGCGSKVGTPYDWALPPGFPEPAVPDENPMTIEKVAFGRLLFYDPRLSFNETTSCSSCHDPARAFTDGKVTPVGATLDPLPRNAMSLTNVAYLSTYTWGNPVLDTLEEQALVPMFGERPIELGMTNRTEEILSRLASDATLAEAFAAAYPSDDGALETSHLVRALASFQRTLISGSSPYDRYIQGDTTALSDAQKRGMDLFFSERLECYHCHAGLNFTTAFRSAETRLASLDFQNTGLYHLDGPTNYPPSGLGLYEFTQATRDAGKFRVPTLRNIELTAPYMHDGSIAELEDVIQHYARGGRLVADGPWAGDGATNPNKSPLVRGFSITQEERDDVISFLKSLTDEAFVARAVGARP